MIEKEEYFLILLWSRYYYDDNVLYLLSLSILCNPLLVNLMIFSYMPKILLDDIRDLLQWSSLSLILGFISMISAPSRENLDQERLLSLSFLPDNIL